MGVVESFSTRDRVEIGIFRFWLILRDEITQVIEVGILGPWSGVLK